MNPSGSRLYVSHRNFNTVSTIHTGTSQVIATTRVGESPWGIAVSPDGGKVYVANEYSSNVSVIDAIAHGVVATIPVGSGPVGISVTPDGSQLYVANRGDATIQAVNLATYTTTTFNVNASGVTGFGHFINPSLSHCMGNPTTFRLTMNPLPFPSFSILRNSSDAGSVVTFDNGSSAGNMLWHFGDPLNSTSTERNPTFWYRENGIYQVTLKVTDAAGCSNETFMDIRVTGVRTDLKALSLLGKVTVSPNPFSERLQLSIENQLFTFRGKERLLVTNGIGQCVYERIWNTPLLELDTQTWAEGIYNLTLDADGVKIPIQKVVKYFR
jgi:YVTN family beta-propeller protein